MTPEDFTYELKPWVFGYATYKTLKNYHSRFPIFDNDIFLHRNHHVLKVYDIQSHDDSLWKRSGIMPDILHKVAPIQEQLKSFIGRDLSVPEIEDLIKMEDFPNHAGSPRNTHTPSFQERLYRIGL